MLSVEQCEKILDIENIHYGTFFNLDCQMNTLEIPCKKLTISLSETQKRLLICLTQKINNKRDIINIVWYENHQCVRDNNYHQLVFQLRALLQRNQLPTNILITVPYYGLKINEPLLRKIEAEALHHYPAPLASQNNVTDKDNKPSLKQWLLNAIR
ncbi:winged helix-turn-helix domain-containing protein [Erwinia amylovora]|uniref:winged helix-turn-helix domain-containing protein n=1 Tax=Erwinia amylovora TaxID=552 RepID=UPI0037DC51A5